jgi:hypothetical protein
MLVSISDFISIVAYLQTLFYTVPCGTEKNHGRASVRIVGAKTKIQVSSG